MAFSTWAVAQSFPKLRYFDVLTQNAGTERSRSGVSVIFKSLSYRGDF